MESPPLVASAEQWERKRQVKQEKVRWTTPGEMALALDPNTVQRPHLELIDQAFAQVMAGEVDRVIITTPPQVGKTQRAGVWGPFWWLSHRPKDQVLLVSYGADLARGRGRMVRHLVREHGDKVGLVLNPEKSAANEWSLTTGGGMRTGGTQSGITGYSGNCLGPDTHIMIPGGVVRVADFVRMATHPPVLSWNHETNRQEWRNVLATQTTEGKQLVEIRTAGGRVLHCTEDHRIYVPGRGYVPAGQLRPGTPVRVADVPSLPAELPAANRRGGEGETPGTRRPILLPEMLVHIPRPLADLQGMQAAHVREARKRENVLLPGVPQGEPADGGYQMWALREGVRRTAIRGGETHPGRHEEPVLFAGVPVRVISNRAPVPGLRCRPSPEGEAAVFAGVPEEGDRGSCRGTQPPNQGMPELPDTVPAQTLTGRLLLPPMCESSALFSDDWEGQLPLPRRAFVRELVPADASRGDGAGRPQVRRMPEPGPPHHVHPQRQADAADRPSGSPRQRGPEGQPTREPGHRVPHMSCGTPSLGNDTVSVVQRVRGEGHTVYDLQVEGNSNLFADSILVHNCLILDDPHKDRAEADSHTVKEAIWDTYSSTLLSRLSPGAPIILIQTRWSPDDLAGRVLAEEGSTEDGGRWRVIHLPAMADPRFGPDPIGRGPGEPLPHPRIEVSDVVAARKHWEEKKRTSTLRDWAALYQGDPRPIEGALITPQQLAAQRHYGARVAKQVIAVSVDPSGGGRHTAGIIGGFLGVDKRLYWTHDVSGVLSADEWPRAAAQLAHDTKADRLVYEKNYGGKMVKRVIRTAWDALSNESVAAGGESWGPPPRIVEAHAKRGKLLRAEPIAQQIIEDRIRIAAPLLQVETEWTEWRVDAKWSPGRIDASVYLAYSLLPIQGAGAVVSFGGMAMASTQIA